MGLLVPYDNDCGKDVWARVTTGYWFCKALSKTVKSRDISKHIKQMLNLWCCMVVKCGQWQTKWNNPIKHDREKY